MGKGISQPLILSLLLLTAAIAVGQRHPTTAPATSPATSPATTQSATVVETHFSAEEEIAKTVVNLIDGAQRSLNIAAFTFNHPDITSAIIRAHQRGVRVAFIMDYTQSRLKTCSATDLIDAGIEVRTRHRRGFQHNKYIVIDESIVISGSYNFTTAADAKNTENLLVIRNAPEVVENFLRDHRRLIGDSLKKHN